MIKYILITLCFIAAIGCNKNDTKEIKIDGSSTVYPVMEKLAEKYNKKYPNERPTIGTSGTGGGFKKFLAGEIDITNASRPIEKSEIELAEKNKIEFIEIPIALDGLTVVINKENNFAEKLTVKDLNKIWEVNSKIKKWSDLNLNYPDEQINLYGPGTDSGTFDFFTKVINGTEKSSRSEYQASEDDNTLVQGVVGDKYALGYFGYAYYVQNKENLKSVKIYNEDIKEYVEPNYDSVISGAYLPLSRPLFIYVNKKSLDKKEVMNFVKFILEEGSASIKELGYVPLPEKTNNILMLRVIKRLTGTQVHEIEKDTIKNILNSEK